ncbi:MAG: acyltransferase family protein [Anaerolineae bacterium]|nr:acyltransferase family protein [Anaerolineae bacterium]
MNRRLFLLNGIAIVAVVCNHATHVAYLALFANPNRPNLSELSGDTLGHSLSMLAYYVLFFMEKLAVFSVPAFLFTAGCFAAYGAQSAARKSAAQVGNYSLINSPLAKLARARIVGLVVPHIIWSLVAFGTEALRGQSYSASQYAARLLYGGALSFYFYVPVLCQLYVLLPWLAPLAKQRPQLALWLSGGAQALLLAVYYWMAGAGELSGPRGSSEGLSYWFQINRHWSFAGVWGFFFVLGLVYGFHAIKFKTALQKLRWVWLGATIALGAAMLAEADVFLGVLGINVRFSPVTLPANLYALACIACFLAFDQVQNPRLARVLLPQQPHLRHLLTHGLVFENTRFVLTRLTPWQAVDQLLYQPALIALAVVIPVLVMAGLVRSPARRLYPFLFG